MNRKSIIKLFIVIACSLIVFYLIIEKISGFSTYVKNDFDQYISVEIKHSDGTVNYYDSNSFPLVSKGDIVFAKVNLPKDKYIKNGALCFHSNHSIINVYDNNNSLLYTYGQKNVEKDEMIGGTSVFVHIPEEAWGKSLTIQLEVTEYHSFSKIQEVIVLDSIDSYKYLIGDKEAEIMLFVTMFVSSLVVFFILIFNGILNGKWDPIMRQGIFLVLFLSLISVWTLAYNNVLDLFSSNKVFNWNIEYIALFSCPMMLSLFFYEQDKRLSSKRMHLAFAVMYGVFALICIVLNYTTVNYHYCEMLLSFCVLLVLGVIAELFVIIKHDESDDLSVEALRCGGILFLVIVVLELIKTYLYKYANYQISTLTQNLSSIELIIFIISIVSSYAVQLVDHYMSEYEKRKLEKLAYYDILTGIGNRAACYRCFKILDFSKDTAIVFIDANNLKQANDTFGHGMGDRFIKFIAEALQTSFRGHGFYGRFGGDEFIAVINSDEIEKVYDCMNNFNGILSDANKRGSFPFEVSVSYGISISKKDNPISVRELIKNADNKMYQNKKNKKTE